MSSQGPLSVPGAARLLLSVLDEGNEAAVITVVDHDRQELVGGRLVWDGRVLHGSLQDGGQDSAVVALARKGLSADRTADVGLHVLDPEGHDGVRVFLELHRPPSEMIIVGAGHLAQPLCTLGALLDLQVTVLDDRPEFATRERFPEARVVRRVDFADPFRDLRLHRWSHVLLVTRGHRFDYECLRRVLRYEPGPGYVGMIGSRRRVRATFEALLDEGFPREGLNRVRAPIGLDLGAETPAEIAVAVAAEIVHGWYGGSCLPLSRVERVLDRLIPEPPPGETGS